jgi:glycine/D-amino acid oxidase-like deaminating enzyme
MTIDRRDFLKQAGAGAGVLALAGCATGGARASWPAEGSFAIGTGAPDVVVIGAGSFGAWTAWHLRQLGASVLVLDAYGPANARATSADETRGVRTSYGDRPHGEQWLRWAAQSIRKWQEWDETIAREQGTRLFFTTGDVIARPEWENFTKTTRGLFEKNGIAHETVSPADAQKRWPAINFDGLQAILYERDAGVVRARAAIHSVMSAYRNAGGRYATARIEPLTAPSGRVDSVRLTDGTVVRGGQFVVATGPWMYKTLPAVLANRIRTPLGVAHYIGTPPGDHRFTHPNLPSWNIGPSTGWPTLDEDNVGFRLRVGGGPVGDPDTSERLSTAQQNERARLLLAQRFPALKDMPILRTHACHYEGTPSRNFIIDSYPDTANLWIAGGGNAEAFKSGPVIGEYVARRVLGKSVDASLAAGFAIPKDEFEPTPPATPPPLDEF